MERQKLSRGGSLMGYTPLFDSMLTGTLYGRWPHTGIWACLLSRATREGLIDETPQALAAAIGVPVETLTTCIRDFMNPDPDSRSPEQDGRRLALIHEHRSWGWRVINHSKYRDKARKKAFDEGRVESGENRERMRDRRATHDDPTRPDATRRDPPSDAEATPTQSKPEGAQARLVLHESLPKAEWEEWLEHRRAKRMPVDSRTLRKQLAVLASYDTPTQVQIIATSINAGWQGLFPLKNVPHGTQRTRAPSDDWQDLRHRASKIGFRDPGENESAAAYQTLLSRAELEARNRKGGLQSAAAAIPHLARQS